MSNKYQLNPTGSRPPSSGHVTWACIWCLHKNYGLLGRMVLGCWQECIWSKPIEEYQKWLD